MQSLRQLVSTVVDGEDFGPNPAHLPSQFAEIPYAPFSKNDKLGRVVDWNVEAVATTSGPAKKYNTREPKESYGANATNTFAYFHDQDEASFSLVDGNKSGVKRGGSTPAAGGGGLSNLGRSNQFNRTNPSQRGGPIGARGGPVGRGGRGGAQAMSGRGGRGGAAGGRFGWKDWNKEQRIRDASVVIASDWVALEEIEFSRLAKLRLDVDTEDVETMYVLSFSPDCGCPPSLSLRIQNERLTISQFVAWIPVRVRQDVRPSEHQVREAPTDHRAYPLQPHHVGRPDYPGGPFDPLQRSQQG